MATNTGNLSLNGNFTFNQKAIEAAGGLLYVDAVYGNDSTALPQRADQPYLTLTAAKNAASANQTIIVRPGTYNERNLLKNYVNWYFENGATVNYTGNTAGGIFDDTLYGANASIVSVVSGSGFFLQADTDATDYGNTTSPIPHSCINIANANTVLNLNGLSFRCSSDASVTATTVRHLAGNLSIQSNDVTGQGNNSISSVWWSGGELRINSHLIQSGNVGGNAYYATANSDNAWITADLINCPNDQDAAIYTTGNDSARSWIDVKEVLSNAEGIDIGGGRNYIRAEKISPFMIYYGGRLWLTAQKIPAIVLTPTDGSIIYDGYISSQQLEDTGSSGALISGSVTGAGQKVRVDFGVMTCGNTASGASIAGNITLSGRIDTTANPTGIPLTLTGNGCILQNSVLVSNGTQTCITPSAGNKSLAIYGMTMANNNKHANATILCGNLSVNANVT